MKVYSLFIINKSLSQTVRRVCQRKDCRNRSISYGERGCVLTIDQNATGTSYFLSRWVQTVAHTRFAPQHQQHFAAAIPMPG